MRLLIVDDHEMIRRGVSALLSGQSGWKICGEAVDGQDALEKARALRPDVIVMDISMPRLDGLEATRQIRAILPECEILILSQHENAEMVRQALNAGARGYVSKGSISEDLVRAVGNASRHEYFFGHPGSDRSAAAQTDVQEILQRSAAFEKALAKSEESLRKLSEYQAAVMNNMAEGLYAVDENGLLTSINPAAEAILGWRQEELVGKKMHDMTHYQHPDGSPFPAEECPGLKVLREGAVLREHEDNFVRKDGSFVPVVFSASPLWGDGAIRGVIVSFRDDTEQRDAKTELLQAKREAEINADYLDLVTKSMAAAVTRCDKNLRYVWANKRYTEWLARPTEQIVGQRIEDVLGREAFAKLLPHFRAVLSGESVSYEEEVTFASIGRRWISAAYTPTHDARGEPDGWVAVVWDITERKRVEQALRDSQEQLGLALHSSRTAMFDWDNVARRGSWNPQMTELYEFTPRGQYITPEEWGELFHPDDRARLTEEAARVWRSRDDQFTFEFRTVRRSGEIRWILSHGRIMRDSEGQPVRMIGTHTDVTEGKRAAQALKESDERLLIERQRYVEQLQRSESRLRALSESLDSEVVRQTEQVRQLSHRLLRTQDDERRRIARELHDSVGQTLAALGMAVALIAKDAAKISTQAAGRITEIENFVRQLQNEIRTMSYLLHPPLLDEIGLSSALQWYTRGLSERSGIAITVDAPEEIGRLPADLELAIFRLVQEGLTNIHRHSGSKTASIRLSRTANAVKVELADQGQGISSERLSEIQSGRAGIGIRGMQERLRGYSGTLCIESDGEGTRLVADIPLTETLSAAGHAPA